MFGVRALISSGFPPLSALTLAKQICQHCSPRLLVADVFAQRRSSTSDGICCSKVEDLYVMRCHAHDPVGILRNCVILGVFREQPSQNPYPETRKAWPILEPAYQA